MTLHCFERDHTARDLHDRRRSHLHSNGCFEGETYTDTKTEIIPVKGDANGDEVVTVEDATLLQMCLAEFGITQETQS